MSLLRAEVVVGSVGVSQKSRKLWGRLATAGCSRAQHVAQSQSNQCVVTVVEARRVATTGTATAAEQQPNMQAEPSKLK